MRKIAVLTLLITLSCGAGLQAQFRKIPAAVTDSFKKQYPDATNVEWKGKLSYFESDFTLAGDKYIAKYNSAGEWKTSEKTILEDKLPAAVKDGYQKSKYTDEWKIKEYTVLYLPGNITHYRLFVRKSGLSKKYLVFNDAGKLLEETSTL